MPVLKIENITINNQQHNLLKNLSLTVNSGEHWLIVGAGGSGKTVLLNTIAGKLRPMAGTIEMDLPESKTSGLSNWQPVSLVTSRHQFKDLTNTNNLYYQQRYNSSDSDHALTVLQFLQARQTVGDVDLHWDIENTVTLLNLNHLLYKEIIKLSNGETKRLRIAAALLHQPQILLLDDPLSGLDQQTQQDFGNILEQIIATNVTIIMSGSGHEIPAPITHVAIMEDGTIVETLPVATYMPQAKDAVQLIDAKQIAKLTGAFTPSRYNWIARMENVTVKYNELTILKNINWQIKQGDRWALFGHNGAGKSTLLSLINGDNPQAYANNIVLFDKKRGTGESIWDIKSKIGFLSPELYQYFPTDQSGLQVIESGYYDTQGLFRQSHATRAAKALEWMTALHIDAYARKPLKSMPASVQRLCLLARALIKNPPLLILDEPCQGLDKLQRQYFNALIDTIIASTGLTLIYVTHYANEMPACINKVLTLEKGEVVNFDHQ
jgi:molybdate transport system ATP-binding protein